MTDPLVCFTVQGKPVPKQSFRYTKRGGRYTPTRVKDWQSTVGWAARLAYRGRDPLSCPLRVQCLFHLPNKRRVDSDNLSKAVLDSCNGILWEDDRQVCKLEVEKCIDPLHPGVDVCVSLYETASPN